MINRVNKKNNIEDIYPVTPIQSGLIFRHLYQPDSDAYFLQSVFELKEVNIDQFKQSWQMLLERHDGLRACFAYRKLNNPVQIIYKKPIARWKEEDIQHLTYEEKKEKLNKTIEKERKEGFDIQKAPLMRFNLLRIEEDKYYFIWNRHHLLIDGWCGPIILGELREIYESLITNSEPNLKQRRSYRDYIKWLQNQDQEVARDYWQKELLGVEATKISTESKGEDNYAEDILILSEQETNNLNKLAKDSSVTLNTIFQAIWALILSQQTRQQEVVFGVTVSGRNIDLEGVEDMVGIFINTIPLRISINPREALQDFLRRIQNKMSLHQERAYISLAEIQATQKERQLFDTLFVFENYPRAKQKATSFNNFSLKKYQSLEKTEYTLTLAVIPGNETRLCFSYNKKHLQKHQITHFKQVIQQFCELLVKEGNNLIGNINIITPKELIKLQTWNETKHEYPKDKTIYQLFEESVRTNPDRIAITYEEQQISYRVLNQRVNQLAHYLIKQGVSLETPVAISTPRGPELIIGLLAILKSGGIYVPIDHEYPLERIHYMLEDSNASILLTTKEIRDGLELSKIHLNNGNESNVVSIPCNPHLKNIKIICFDEESLNKSLQLEEDTNPNIQIPTDSLCYIIYTSGSTGRPKGVGVRHDGLINRLLWQTQELSFNSEDRVLQKTSVSFDVSIWELLLSFIKSSCLICIVSNKDQEQLKNFFVNQKITKAHFVPSGLSYIASYFKEEKCNTSIIFSGEILTVTQKNKVKEIFNQSIYNLYGPTEATIDVSFFKVGTTYSDKTPIGHPIHNTQIHILDSNLNQVPIGTTGEIYIGGAGLARGYIGKPGLTSEKFIANPFVAEVKEDVGTRLYKTGDLARYLPDGNIEFIGRIDHQVKLRGFRIELGEIESALSQHNQIKQAVVLAREDIPGQKRLVGYVVLKEASTKDKYKESRASQESEQTLITSLRELTAKFLPDYMQLSQIVILDELPLTQNGKLDRKALPAPEGREGVGLYQAPEGLLEQKVAVIWQELLKIDKVGRNDNFFNLGGHSLIATQLIAKIRSEQKIEIPLQAIFEHPTLQEFARSLTDEYLSQDTLPPIERASRNQLIPLSFAQQRLWFIDQLVTGKGLYHIPRAVRLGKELDVSALRKALNHMVRRHEILRTLIISKEGVGTQLILNEDTPFNLTELTVDTKKELDDYLALESISPFDFEKTPLCRGSLIKCNESEEYILLIIFHHIISDGWSAGIWNRELSELYLSYKENIEPSLLPLPIQYADFSIWQRNWLSGDVLEKQLHYWQEQLADISMLELPTDYPRPKQQSYKGSSYSFQLNKEVVDSLNRISKDNDTTLFMTILSAFQGTLSKYSNQTDIVVGTPIAGRRMQETEGLIGFFVNTLVLRASTEHNPTFKELLSQVKDTTLEAYTHQDIPFEQLVEHLNMPRDLSRHPVFQVMLILQNNKQEELKFGDIKPQGIGNSQIRKSPFDIKLNITETKEGLNLRCEYASDLFKQETIARLCNYYTSFIDEIIQDQDKRLSDIFILDERELTKLQTWNETKHEYPRDKTIHQLFEESVAKTPDRIAITYEDQKISYRVLNQRVNQLAHYLIKQGVSLETPVAISTPRGPELIIGLLAILKSGGTYVPIDHEYPLERIHYMLEDSNASILLTTKEIRDSLELSKIHLNNGNESNVVSIPCNPHLKNINIICLDEEVLKQSLESEKETNPNIQISSDSLCYIIYTSGSTGRPKGVGVCYSSIMSRISYLIKKHQINRDWVIVNKISSGFDPSLREMFLSIITGAKLSIISKIRNKNTEELVKYCIKEKPNLLLFTPSHLDVFVNTLSTNQTNLRFLRIIYACGEYLESSLLNKSIKQLPNTTFKNQYGPTEGCQFSFEYSSSENKQQPKTIPVGKLVDNMYGYILDSNLNQVPIGTTGEIYIGGAGLARGYIGKPGLTSEKFIANPFVAEVKEDVGTRLYKTGDLARYLPDGNIEFIGRIDHQVKLRGFRIELGEIESALSQHNQIKQAVVLAREDIPGQKRLVGYVVLKEASTKDKYKESRASQESEQTLITSLRELTAKSLPDYMQLSQIVILDELPLTQNGKLDRKALPAPEGREGVGLYQAPEGLLEQKVAVIWQELLKIDKVGRNDNFFNLGGHSLNVLLMIAKLRSEEGIEVSIDNIFEHPTLQEFARSLTDEYLSQDLLPPIERASRNQLIPLSFAQQRLWFIDQLVTGKGLYHIPRAVRLGKELDVSALRKALNHMVRRHEILRTLIISKEGVGTQLILNEDTPFNLTELTVDTKKELDDYLALESISPFDFEKTPLCRGSLIKCNESEEYILLIIFHHIISDGWSAGIWNRELSALYLCYKENIEPSLLPLPIQYADFSIWQRNWLSGDVLEKQLHYWQEQLADISMLELPTDYPRPKQQSYKGSSYSFQLNKEVVDSLNRISKDNDTTLFMTILSAFQGTLSKYSNQTDIVVGTPIAGRRMQETEGLIGFFVNTLVLRASTEHNPTFKELLSQVKDTTLEAYTHQDIPFEQLVEHLNMPRDLSRHPVFQVMLILQNNKQEELKFGDIKPQGIGTNNRQAKFDLTLNIIETKEGLNLRCEYASDLFKQETIARLCNYYTSFIDEIIQDQDKRLSDIFILDERELTKLQTWNETKHEYPRDKTIHQLFEESVAKTPDRIAITYEDQQISYRVLNQRVNQLAHYLIKQGVSLETPVAISTPRGPELIIGLLAILKSGGTYVPIDHEYPLERIHYMLEDSNASILLTTKEIRDGLGLSQIHLNNEQEPNVVSISSNLHLKNVNIICLDEEVLKQSLQLEKDTNPNIQIPADSLCYIIYTSGSTGRPKGITCIHRGMVNRLFYPNSLVVAWDNTIGCVQSNSAFVDATWDIFSILTSNSRLVLYKELISKDIEEAANIWSLHGVKRATITPSILSNLIDLTKEDIKYTQGIKIKALKIQSLKVTGEYFDVSLSKDLFETNSSIINLLDCYGATEATSVIYRNFDKNNTEEYSTHILSNTQIHILDSNLNQVPIGTTGEIHISGAGLARGYIGKPGLTSEKFIANPYGNKEDINIGTRLYKTGDLGRYLPDGNIEFIGRIDHQVKIRGFRIELGEIESALSQHNQIKQAVVLAREDIPGQKRLVGYVVLKEASTKDKYKESRASQESEQTLITSLRELTAKSLPDYMQLSQIVILDELPLTQNGKLDRKALPAPEGREGVGLYQAPEGLLEQKVAVIWQELLKIDKVGRNDNFFNLGGHSLIATQLIAKIRSEQKIEIPLQAIFEHPTLQEFARSLTDEYLSQDTLPPIERASRNQLIPLSFAQQRLWFIDQLVTGKGLYHIPRAVRLAGELDILALRKALNHMVRRHEILRTLIISKEGVGTQLILNEDTPFNLTELTVDTKEEMDVYLAKESISPFDFEKTPLCRGSLIKCNESEEYILLIIFHHIISDGWSAGIWNRELSALYLSYKENIEANLLPLPIQYADFSIWQRNWLSGDVLEKQLHYWQEQLAGIPQEINLPTDRARPKSPSYEGDNVSSELGVELTKELEEFALKRNMTPFTIAFTAFSILMHRYSQQDDVVIGTPVANRGYTETENLIGFFVNTLALRVRFNGLPSFEDICNQVKQITLDGYANQNIPFEQIVDHLKIERSLSRNPVFQVWFTLNDMVNEEKTKLTDIQLGKYNILGIVQARYDLHLGLRKSGNQFNLNINYSKDLFNKETIERIIEHYALLLQELIKEPRQLISRANILTVKEQAQLNAWNETKHEYPRDKTIHQLFEESVAKTPDRIAITYEDQKISYRVLNQRVNQLAHYLIKQGVSLETPVAISTPRGPELIIGLLAILKSGGTYVPIDHEYPLERIHYMLEDSNASILLTTKEIRDGLGLSQIYLNNEHKSNVVSISSNLHLKNVNIICLDEELLNQNLQSEKDTNPNIQIPADSLCYIIYTSGSTGKPKGVGVRHGNLTHYLNYSKEVYVAHQEAITLLHSSIAFDMSITSLYLPLVTGNVIYILPSNSQSNSLETIPKELDKINFLKLTPTHLKALKNQDVFRNTINKVGCLVIGGENLLKEDIVLLFNHSFSPSSTSIFNEYGPTETTVGCCTFKVEQLENLNQVFIPIGRPIHNTQIYILDSNLNQVSIGTTGEIYIGGEGLTRGYVGKPGLTSEKFIANPFICGVESNDNKPNNVLTSNIHSNNKLSSHSLRIYRTGDLARYLPDGNMEFLGRIDDQVKIRGFRIELGEIESVLSSHGDVAQAIVVAKEENKEAQRQEDSNDSNTSKQLIAYFVPREFTPSDTELREYLSHLLPDYMIPSFFVCVDKIQLTPNGKIDKKALPIPDVRLRKVGSEYMAPTTGIEKILCSIWSKVLGIERVGRNDNFFNLGGHSLIATQLIAKIRSEQKIEIPLQAIFEHPTLQEFARSLTDEYLSQDTLPPIERASRNQLIPLSFAQQRLWFIDQLVTGKGLYHIPRAVRLGKELDVSALRKALNHMVRRHEILRTLIISKEGVGTQLILNEDTPFNLTELTVDTKKELDDYLALESISPFDFEKTPLCRGSLIKCNESEEYILLIIFHHIISDGWSAGIWNRELSELYLSYKENIEPSLLPLPIQYADFSIWQRNWLSGDVLEKQLHYWQEQLAGIPQEINLPTDRARPKSPSYEGDNVSSELGVELTKELEEFALKRNMTPFTIAFTAFSILMHRYSQQDDVVIGTPVANRGYTETENLIGFFVNTLALRVRFNGLPSFEDICNQVKQITLDGYANQNIPFEQIVDHLKIERSLSRNPVFQIEFGLDDIINSQGLSFSGINVSSYRIGNNKSKFDLRAGLRKINDVYHLNINYAKDLFNKDTVQNIIEHYKLLLQEVIKHPNQPINTIGFLTARELTKLQTWNETKHEYPRDKTIHQLFEESVAKTPDRIAITYEDQQISYRALNQRVNQLAHYLIKQGVSLETPVAISTPRGPELIIGLLAILKSGGTYVPIDHEYPLERIHYMLEDSKAPIILTHSSIIDKLPNSWAMIITIDEVEQELQKEESINPNIQISPESLCYIIYTSGSTGRPKGVGVSNSNLTHYLNYSKEMYFANQEAISLLHSSVAFDMSITSLYLPLATGNIIYILSSNVQSNSLETIPKKFNKVNFLKFTPTHLKSLNNQGTFKNIINKARCLVIGGENLLKEDITLLFNNNSSLSATSIFNEYGPTETTVGCCVLKIDQLEKLHQGSIPIGTPIHNTKIHILDSNLNQVPIGTTGEIHISGAGLARGYIGKPGLTSEKFIANPYGNKEDINIGTRLYKTGDLARYLPDGNIEFIGRIDHQVKLRGFRIELGEIESALSQHNQIKQAVVLAREDIPGQKRLVGYVVLKEASTKDKYKESRASQESEQTLITSLRELTAKSLPDYMQLSQIVILDELPLTQNGKLDRKALPAPEGREGVGLYQAPEGLLEQKVAVIWQELLKIDKVGRNDNFFNLGGHSLIATQLIAKIRSEQKIEIPLQAIFEHPTLQEFARSLTDEYLSQDTLPPIERASRNQLIPLSFAQQRLWFIDQLVTGKGLYHIPRAVKLGKELDVSALRKALNHMVRRHEILRTLIISKEGVGTQLILNEDTPFNLTELTVDTKKELDDYLALESISPFDFEKTPLCRGSLIKCNESEEYILLIIFHHIISDGWSAGIWNRELSELYLSYKENIEPSLLPLPIQYADFSIWQRNWLSGDVLEKQLHYWQEQLAGIPQEINLPTDRARPKSPSYEGDNVSSELGVELTKELEEFALKRNMTPFTIAFTAFSILMHRYSQQDDVVIGTPVANRGYTETENLIGFFVNTLALRVRFNGLPSFEDICNQVKQITLDGYANQNIPFEQIVDHLKIERSLSRNPVFQIEFGLDDIINSQGLSFSGINVSSYRIGNNKSKFDLRAGLKKVNNVYHLNIHYAKDLFNKDTVQNIIEHYKLLLQEVIKHPNQPINTIGFLTARELTKLQTWNETKHEYPRDKTIHQLFEESVAKTPDRIAITYEDQQISYRALNQRVNQLAHYLIKQGVSLETPVAISTPRGPELIIGLLAILKSGGTYVPIDHEYPLERIHYMLEDSKAPIILTHSSIIDKLPNSWAMIITIDEVEQELQKEESINPNIQISPESLCYIIYTSGSTGRPKGVGVSNSNLTHYLNYSKEMYFANQEAISLLHSSVAFDMSITSLYLPLATGNIIYILSSNVQSNSLETIPKKFNKVNFLKFTPTHLKSLNNQGTFKNIINKARCLVIGGENLLKEDITLLFNNNSSLSATSIFNEYGPTETTVGCCVLKIDQLEKLHQGSIPIGTPIHNTKIHILDSNLNQVPIGTTGEIHISGAGLARGYIGKPGLTSEKFIANPYGNKEDINIGTRLYKTGDLARYLPDGNIEFIGRIDHQVKLRGFRIELGEIESALSQHNQIKQAVVLAREDIPGQKRLVGYVVLKEASTKDKYKESRASQESEQTLITSLRELTAKFLPDYMQLSQIVILDELPLTQNGKLDRKALPAPEGREGVGLYQAPEGLLEQKVAVIWQELLKIDKVGRNDNFFNLGGHSLIATQLIAKIRSEQKIEIPLQAIFEHPTLQEFARSLTDEYLSQDTLPPIERASRNQLIPLSFAQQRLWFIDQLVTGKGLYHIPREVRLGKELDVSALRKALNHMVRRHEILRTLIISKEGVGTQLILNEDTPFNLTELTVDTKKELDDYLALESISPFDFEKTPLCRGSLIKCNESEEYILLIIFHHIISDGWSAGIWNRELSALYLCYKENIEPSLLPLPIQYADFSIWQRNWLSGDVLEKQLHYWQEQLADISMLELPTDYPRPKQQSYKGSSYSFQLNKEVVDSLNRISKDNDTTLFMTILSAFQGTLSKYSNQTDIVVGTPIAGRRMQETEGLIGFFVNTLVLRASTEHNPTFKELLSQVKDTTLEAYTHQDIPFEQLVEHLNMPRDLSRHPVFQVMLILQNNKQEELKFGDIKPQGIGTNNRQAKFDLTLNIIETKEGLNLRCEYASDLFKQETIARLCNYYTSFIDEIIQDQDKRLSDIFILDERELTKLQTWNETKHEYPRDKTIHQLFEESVAKTPDRIAITYEDQQISYRVLNQRVNQLAHYLIKQGVSLETPVAISTPRGPELIIGLLAILKSGGTYVPIDHEYPLERIHYMLEDSNASILLTTKEIRDGLGLSQIYLNNEHKSNVVKRSESYNPQHFKNICFDEEVLKQSLQLEKDTNPNIQISSDSLCYVIYTSGSTGRPKGIGVNHGNLRNYAQNVAGQLINTNKAVIGYLNSIGTDLGNTALFGSILNGNKLCILKSKEELNTKNVRKILYKQKIDIVKLVPSYFSVLQKESLYNNRVSTKFILGGESLQINSIKHENIINHYGPAETTVGVVINRNVDKNNTIIPIGTPIHNTQIHILDTNLNQVPIGTTGEIFIGGAGLARGYIGKPGLTSEKFIANPFVTEVKEDVGTRLYRTGDLARYLPDGNIEFIGRIDHQVKLRGFRIELGEIESALSQHNQIKQAVVLAREDIPGQKRLVGYVVLKEVPTKDKYKESQESTEASKQESEQTLITSLRELTAKSLPDYMQLSQIVILDEFPLTQNGKLDRKALPAPEGREGIGLYQAPEGLLEQKVAVIWQELLKIDKVGRNDNFFILGGHSLVATLLIAKIRRDEKIEVPLKDIFEHPTLKLFSKNLEKLSKHSKLLINSKNEGIIFKITDEIDRVYNSPLYLIHEGIGIIHPYINLKNILANPLYAIEDPYIGEEHSGFANINEMVNYYAESIKRHHQKYHSHKPISIGGWSFGGIVAYEIAILLNELIEIDNLIIIDTQAQIKKDRTKNVILNKKQGTKRNINRNSNLLIDYKTIESYNSKLTLIKAKTNSHMDIQSDNDLINHDYGWGKFAKEIVVYEAEGNHYTLLHEDNIISIGKILNSIMD